MVMLPGGLPRLPNVAEGASSVSNLGRLAARSSRRQATGTRLAAPLHYRRADHAKFTPLAVLVGDARGWGTDLSGLSVDTLLHEGAFSDPSPSLFGAEGSSSSSGSTVSGLNSLRGTSLPEALTRLVDVSAPVTLPPPGSYPPGSLDNRELDKLISTLGRNRATWRRALVLHEWLQESGHQLDDRLCTTLIRVCAEHGQAVAALSVYEWMRAPRAAGGAALAPTVYTYTAAMRAALSGGLLAKALAIWDDAQAAGCPPDCRLCISHLEVCSKAGRVDEAMAMYAAMKAAPPGSRMAPTVHAFTAAMRAATEGGRWRQALGIWQDMRAAKVTPTGHAYAAAMTACAAGSDWQRAVALFEDMVGSGIRPDVVSCTALISALGAGGQWQRAEQVVGWMARAGLRPNVRTYTALVSALASAQQWDRAAEVLAQMQTPAGGSVAPNAYTYSALLRALAEHGEWQRAEAVFSGIEAAVLAAGGAGALAALGAGMGGAAPAAAAGAVGSGVQLEWRAAPGGPLASTTAVAAAAAALQQQQSCADGSAAGPQPGAAWRWQGLIQRPSSADGAASSSRRTTDSSSTTDSSRLGSAGSGATPRRRPSGVTSFPLTPDHLEDIEAAQPLGPAVGTGPAGPSPSAASGATPGGGALWSSPAQLNGLDLQLHAQGAALGSSRSGSSSSLEGLGGLSNSGSNSIAGGSSNSSLVHLQQQQQQSPPPRPPLMQQQQQQGAGSYGVPQQQQPHPSHPMAAQPPAADWMSLLDVPGLSAPFVLRQLSALAIQREVSQVVAGWEYLQHQQQQQQQQAAALAAEAAATAAAAAARVSSTGSLSGAPYGMSSHLGHPAGATGGVGIVNEVVCGALMSAYERAGKWEEAVGVLARGASLGLRPNAILYNTAMSAAGKAGQVQVAEQLAAAARRDGCLDQVGYETLVGAYGMVGNAPAAEATFRAMVAAGHHPRDFAYCGLIAAHSISGSTTAALRIRLRMQREGVALSVHVYNALIAACERAGRWDQALELHRAMGRDGIEGNGVTAQLMHSVGRQGVASVESAQLTAAALSAAMAAAGTLLIRSGMF